MKHNFQDVGYREYFDLTTESFQFHFHNDGWRNPTTGELINFKGNRWISEQLIDGVWKVIGVYKTKREAKNSITEISGLG